MSSMTMNRRAMLGAAAFALAAPSTARRTVLAQTPQPATNQSWTTGIFRREISWSEAWSRDESVPSIQETDYYDARVDGVVGTLRFDALFLRHQNGALVELKFVPSPDADRSWDVPFHIRPDANVDIEAETGSTEKHWHYGLRFFTNSGVEYGRLFTFTDPEAGAAVEAVILTAPAVDFATALHACQEGITVDTIRPFVDIESGAVQASLDPLIGSSHSDSPTPGA